MIETDIPPFCSKSDWISAISWGDLDVLPGEKHINALIEHIRGCSSCLFVLHKLVEEERSNGPMRGFPRNNILDSALNPVTPDLPRVSSSQEKILS